MSLEAYLLMIIFCGGWVFYMGYICGAGSYIEKKDKEYKVKIDKLNREIEEKNNDLMQYCTQLHKIKQDAVKESVRS